MAALSPGSPCGLPHGVGSRQGKKVVTTLLSPGDRGACAGLRLDQPIAEAASGRPRQSGHQEITPTPDIASARAPAERLRSRSPTSQPGVASDHALARPASGDASPPGTDRSPCIAAWASVRGDAALSGKKPARPAKHRRTAARQEAGREQGRSHSPPRPTAPAAATVAPENGEGRGNPPDRAGLGNLRLVAAIRLPGVSRLLSTQVVCGRPLPCSRSLAPVALLGAPGPFCSVPVAPCSGTAPHHAGGLFRLFQPRPSSAIRHRRARPVARHPPEAGNWSTSAPPRT